MKFNHLPPRRASKRPLKQAGLDTFGLDPRFRALYPAQGGEGRETRNLTAAPVGFNRPAGCNHAGHSIGF